MTIPWRTIGTTAALTAALCCGRTPEPAPAVETAQAPEPPPSGGGAKVTGTLAPGLAPPSSLVALEPQEGVEVPVQAEPALMDQAGTEFIPGFLIAQVGQVVQFRNSEDVLHNIRVSEGAEQKPVLNVATPSFGKFEYKFERPGLYNVGCDIHSTMRADILVMATPYTATTGTDGRFTIVNVKPGRYSLTIYAGAAPVVRSIDVKSGLADLGLIQ